MDLCSCSNLSELIMIQSIAFAKSTLELPQPDLVTALEPGEKERGERRGTGIISTQRVSSEFIFRHTKETQNGCST